MNDKKTVSFGMALAIIFLPILVILLGGLVLRVGFLVPLMLATITASLLSTQLWRRRWAVCGGGGFRPGCWRVPPQSWRCAAGHRSLPP